MQRNQEIVIAAVTQDADAIMYASERMKKDARKMQTNHLELEAGKIESAFEDVSDEARGVPAIYERARALSRN